MKKYENKICPLDAAGGKFQNDQRNFCCFKSDLNQNQDEVLSLHDNVFKWSDLYEIC